MSPILFASRLLPLLLALVACAAAAPPVPPAPPEDEPIEVFFARFQKAVRSGDREAVAALVRFPLAGIEADRATFFADHYMPLLGEGPFRNALLDGTPAELEEGDDGSYAFVAIVGYDANGEVVTDEEGVAETESAMVLIFRPDGAGSWQLTEIQLAG